MVCRVKKGADGKTSYLHIKYSDDGETFTPRILTETESGEDFEEGELDGVVVGEDGLEEEDTFTKRDDPSSHLPALVGVVLLIQQGRILLWRITTVPTSRSISGVGIHLPS